jgi:hypothetical protein
LLLFDEAKVGCRQTVNMRAGLILKESEKGRVVRVEKGAATG